MNTEARSKSSGKTTGFLLVFLAAIVLSSCSPKAQADQSLCRVDLGMRVSIDVTEAKPQVVFDQLAADPDCAITVGLGVRKHITLHMVDATVSEVLDALHRQIDIKYTYDGTHLYISPLTFIDKLIYQARDEWFGKFGVRLPECMQYEDATVSSVLADVSAVSGLKITPWEGEGNRKVTLDLGGMTVDEALEAIVRYIHGHGPVMIKMWNGGDGQHWLVD